MLDLTRSAVAMIDLEQLRRLDLLVRLGIVRRLLLPPNRLILRRWGWLRGLGVRNPAQWGS